MARPANADPERTKQKLVAAASSLFASQGVEATSIREVAKAAGLTMASIHYYFGGKEGLHASCLEQAYDELASDVAPIVEMLSTIGTELAGAAPPELAAVIERSVRDGFIFARGHQPAIRLIMRPLIDRGELDSAWRDGAFVPFLANAAALLGHATGRPQATLRLEVQSLVALIVRYALSSPKELVSLTGLKKQRAAVRAIEDHLAHLARRTLLEAP